MFIEYGNIGCELGDVLILHKSSQRIFQRSSQLRVLRLIPFGFLERFSSMYYILHLHTSYMRHLYFLDVFALYIFLALLCCIEKKR